MIKTTAINNPEQFARLVLGTELWAKQLEIANAVETERRVAVKACHASGKTYAAAAMALRFATRYDNARVILLAPGFTTIRTVLWSQIHSLIGSAKYRLPVTTLNQTELRFGPDNLMIGLSTNDATRLQGHHADHVLIIADEATGIDPSFWPSVEGILASGDSHLLMLGNPTVSSGYFYDAFGRNRELWATISISGLDTPNLEGVSLERLLKMKDIELDTNSHPYLTTRRWIRDRHLEWFNDTPANSPLWQSRVLGEFPESGTNALFNLRWLEAALAPGAPHGDIIIGVDPAEPGAGRDSTAVVAVAGTTIIDSATYNDADALGRVLDFIREHQDGLRIVRVDSIGVGWGFLEQIRAAGYRVEGVKVSVRAEDSERYANVKAERYWNLRARFEKGQVRGLTQAMLVELMSLSYAVTPTGKIAIDDKVSTRSVLGRSPDLAESLMLALGDTESYMDHGFQESYAAGLRAQSEMRDRIGGDITVGPWSPDDAIVSPYGRTYKYSGQEVAAAEDRLAGRRHGSRSSGAMGGKNSFWRGF